MCGDRIYKISNCRDASFF